MRDIKPTKEEQKEFIKRLEDEPAERGVSLTEYIASTGDDEMRELLLRMIKSELQAKKD